MSQRLITSFLLASFAAAGCRGGGVTQEPTQVMSSEQRKATPAEINLVVIGDSLAHENYLTVWDAGLARRFKADTRVSIVRIADIIDGPGRLSRYDNFHPGGEAYRETARRIATILLST